MNKQTKRILKMAGLIEFPVPLASNPSDDESPREKRQTQGLASPRRYSAEHFS